MTIQERRRLLGLAAARLGDPLLIAPLYALPSEFRSMHMFDDVVNNSSASSIPARPAYFSSSGE